jgi:hypothetical protein
MKKHLILFISAFLITIPFLSSAQEEEFISYKVNGLEFHLTDVILEYYPDAYYLHIEGTAHPTPCPCTYPGVCCAQRKTAGKS